MPRFPPRALVQFLTGERAPVVAAAVLAGLLGWQAAGLLWHLVPATPTEAPPPVRISEPDTVDAGDAAGGAARRIAELSLFGKAPGDAGGSATLADTAPADAPQTQLDLELKGLFAVGDGDGFAIIVAGNSSEAVFAPGDRLTGNARVAGVYPDRVLLRRNGELEALWLGDPDEADRGGGEPPATSTREISRTARDLRRQLLNNPARLSRMVRFQPYRSNGELQGFRLRPRGGYEDLLAELGIRPDDVITEINDIPLNDPSRGREALNTLRDARRVEVRFMRDGDSRRMTLELGESG